MVQINFNANNVQPSTGFEPLPAGWYMAIIEDSEEKPTSAGTGKYLQFTFQIVDGEHANRKVWARINIENPSEEAVRIGQAELSALCRAVGVMDLRDTNDLHNKPLRIKVVQEKRRDTGEMGNRVKAYESAGTTGVAAPAARPSGAVQPPAWATKK